MAVIGIWSFGDIASEASVVFARGAGSSVGFGVSDPQAKESARIATQNPFRGLKIDWLWDIGSCCMRLG